jgi:hypothetical protein
VAAAGPTEYVSSSFWLNCRVPEGFAGELHWALHAWTSLHWMGFGHPLLCFLFDHLVSEEAFRSSAAYYIMWHNVSFHGEAS